MRNKLDFEEWLNENYKEKDWCKLTDQLNDFINTTDVLIYVKEYLEYIKPCMPDEVNTKEEYYQYLKDIGMDNAT